MEIAQAQIDQLDDAGYFRLPNALSPELLARWQALADRLETEVVAEYKAGGQPAKAAVIDIRGDARAYRIDDILEREPEMVLDLLACPALMAIARQCSGPGTVPLVVDIVYKHPYPYPHIIWHQGAVHPRTHPYLNVGIYLDDADAGDGCLRYVPGTQYELLDINALEEAHGWNPPGVVEAPAKAGDILVQDMMILHSSAPKRTPGPRRTIYVEYRPAAAIRQEGRYSEAWVRLRERWMAMVLQRCAPEDRVGVADPGIDGLEFADLASPAAEAERIMATWEPPVPAHYGIRQAVHPEYPTPSDLRHLDP